MNETKEFYESTFFLTLIIPIIIIIINTLISRYILGKKDLVEITKIKEEIKQLKSSFQPIVLSTIQLTQEKLIEDKINALKEIVYLRLKLFEVEQFYADGVPFIEDVYDYNKSVYEKVGIHLLEKLKIIVSQKGYLFPDKIKNNMNLLIFDLTEIYNIQKREYSLKKMEMPDKANKILDSFSEKLNTVIDDIRKDLHIDDNFIHDFINKYKTIE